MKDGNAEEIRDALALLKRAEKKSKRKKDRDKEEKKSSKGEPSVFQRRGSDKGPFLCDIRIPLPYWGWGGGGSRTSGRCFTHPSRTALCNLHGRKQGEGSHADDTDLIALCIAKNHQLGMRIM